jgi:hypothetical protein
MEYTIYSITCIDAKVKGIYVGSTKDFANRQRKHVDTSIDAKTEHRKLYKCITANGGWDNWNFTILENCTCETQSDAFIKERLWYDNLEANLNMNRPYITREEVQEQQKHYYDKNKDVIIEYRKKYRVEKMIERNIPVR